MAQYSRSKLLLPLLFLALASLLAAKDDPVVFKSDVAMTRVDAQVVDRDGHAITGLEGSDFVLRLGGRVVPIRNFASENMPIDILLLLDVSGSMRPHVQRIASAAEQALNVLADKDRVAVMVFDTSTRVRLPFRSSHAEITNELNHLLRSERFNGGTEITHALLDAAAYVERNARRDARRAIVILTDDETQDEEDEPRVETALARANAVLSFLQAPYEPPNRQGGGHRRGTWGSGGGGAGWPGGGWPGGGGVGFPGGGGPWGRRGQGGSGGGDRSHSAGTADIARDSGGDTMPVDQASSLEDTLAKLRQRYALYFYLPEGTTPADQQSLAIDLSQEARLRFQEAEIRYRRVYMSGTGSGERNGPVVSRAQGRADTSVDSSSSEPESSSGSASTRARAAVNEDSGPRVNTVDDDTGTAPSSHGGWPRATDQKTQPQ